MSDVLVLAVHPDDETMGAGGTLLKHKAEGDRIHWLIGTHIPVDHPVFKGKTAERQREIDEVAGLYAFDSVHQLDVPTLAADTYSVADLVAQVSQVFEDVRPEILYLPFFQDVHSDHRALFEAAYACTKVFRYPFVKEVYMMEVQSETDFAPSMGSSTYSPNTFVDISPYMQQKLDIMAVFESEVKPHPFPRSLEGIKALATLRGASAGVCYAESFQQIKRIR